jgi:isoleucyl-tRNA synthetase
MPFAQYHYPFENKEFFETRHPADFICEAIDQTRGWFFSLLAISTLMFDEPAYENVICLGHVVDNKGKKMSKSKGNIMDPDAIFDEFGADSVRWYFYSAISAGEQYRTGRESIQDVVRRFMLTLWNTYSFFVTYAEIDGFDPGAPAPEVTSRPALDRWCLARLAQTLDGVRESLDAYDATAATRLIESFVEDLSKWYVRRSRRRFWKTAAADDADKSSAYATLFCALDTLAGILAPFMPFLAERMYRNLNGFNGDHPRPEQAPSVHLTDFPHTIGAWRDADLVGDMAHLRRVVEEGLAARETAKIKVRQPLAKATVFGKQLSGDLAEIAADELNVKQVVFEPASSGQHTVELDTHITDELRQEGWIRELSRTINDLRKKASLELDDRITLHIDANGDLRKAVESFEKHLRAETLANEIKFGRTEALAIWEGDVGGTPCWLGVTR